MTGPSSDPKRPAIALTPNSRVRVRSAGPEEGPIVSTGHYRGLVSIAGDSALAIELDGTDGEEKGRTRLVPVPAILAIDILEVAKAEEEKRSEPSQAAAYFR